ncbi:MAG TPA: hypothetical protein VGU68_10760 [Ktedonobacteraceae bacterium]|nr:hypothetical protein [Ktedonobacteraceae bacterium]
MMKVVAAALVLIAGAAVVLWFGNTLNSWVLGGLIGGLAAILISIPISLTLFSYLSRRHDEQLRAEAELDEYSQIYEDVPARVVRRTYAAEGYALKAGPEEEAWYEEEEYYQQRALPRQAPRSLPPPRPQRYSEQSQTLNRLPAAQQNPRAPLPRPAQKNVARGKDTPGRRTTRYLNTPGSPGYEPGSMLRSQRSAALRAARVEKARQEDDVEVMPTHTAKQRIPTVRPERDMTGQYGRVPRPRPTHQLSPRDLHAPLPPQRRNQFVGAHSPLDELSPSSLDRDDIYSHEDPDTENLSDMHYPNTGSFRRPTGQIERHPHLNDSPSGSINKPLQRRAPYMYEDDPLREELWQQLPPRSVRRSSRHEEQDFDEEE